MYKYFLLILLLSFFKANAQEVEIRSLKTYIDDPAIEQDEITFPVLVYDAELNPNLKISFDVNSEFEPRLSIVFRFCDKNWKPYTNLMLTNSGENILPYLNFTLLPSTIEDAKYHYDGTFPDADGYITLPFSGKWQYYITESNDTSVIYASGKFLVVRDPLEMRTSIKREILETQVLFPADLAKVFNLSVELTLPEDLFPFYVENAEIIENHKILYPFKVSKGDNNDFRQFYWDGSRRFRFTSKEIKPGNEYRQTDLRNTNIYSRKTVKAQFEGPETSRFFQEGRRDLNGASILMPYDDEYADYLNVEFNLRAPSDFNKDVLVTGAFNNWVLDPAYRLGNSGGFYTGVLNMKRGIYDYQYVAANVTNNKISEIDWVILEGNNWTTQNVYHVFIYYADPNLGGYDRIIGYSTIMSK